MPSPWVTRALTAKGRRFAARRDATPDLGDPIRADLSRHVFEQGGPLAGDRDCRCGADRYDLSRHLAERRSEPVRDAYPPSVCRRALTSRDCPLQHFWTYNAAFGRDLPLKGGQHA